MVVASNADQVLVTTVDAGLVPRVAALAARDEGVVYAGDSCPHEIGTAVTMSLDTALLISSGTLLTWY